MKRDVDRLADETFDLVIVGGGIFGACALWDAALRGLSVALIEKEDFAHATSAHSFKMVHGGIRYLQHPDLARVRQSSRERRALLRIAPHLVEPLPIVIPTFGHGREGKAFLTAGVWLYDALVADRNRGIPDAERRIPRGRTVSRDEVLSMFPQVDSPSLTGGVVFHDAQMYNPPRLALAFVRSAVEQGAAVANYVECVDFLRQDDRIIGIRARDRLAGLRFEIRGRIVLNAAGPWAHELLDESLGVRLEPSPSFSRDAAFVYTRQICPDNGLAIQGSTHDPDAVLGRSARHLFIVPWRNYSLVGVWHVVHKGDPGRFTVTDEELSNFLEEVNRACPDLDLSLDEVGVWNAGLVLFGENDSDARHLRYGHRSILEDHASTHGIEGLLTLIGVRYTTARAEAEHAIDIVHRKLGRKGPSCSTEATPLSGGDIGSVSELQGRAVREYGNGFPPDVLRRLVRDHGSRYRRVLRHLESNPDLSRTLGDSGVIGAEVVQAVQEEMALRLGDVVFRRTGLATAVHPGMEALRDCARIMADELGWSDAEARGQIDRVTRRLDRHTPGRGSPSARGPTARSEVSSA